MNDKKQKEYYGIIYKITNLINEKIYIGQTTLGLKRRWWQHRSDAINRPKQLITSSIGKYGEENFNIEEIDSAHSRNELNEKEKYWISHYNSCNKNVGYNIESGGSNSGVPHTQEHKNYIRKLFIQKNGNIGAFKHFKTWIAHISVNNNDYRVYGIKDRETCLEIYDSMAKYYLKENAVLNFPGRDDIDPLSVNDCRKVIKFINLGLLYNNISRRNGNYSINLSIKDKVITNFSFFKSQIDAAYVTDYYNRKHDLDENSINFPDIILKREDIIEILKRNQSRFGPRINYDKV